MSVADRLIERLTRGIPVQPVVTFSAHGRKARPLFDRYEIMRWDEWPDSWWDSHKEQCNCSFCGCKKKRPLSLPWWLPFNMFLHHWKLGPNTPESFHDHPRWSITICLKGRIIERTPWSKRLLKPGSIVIRSSKYIHSFEIPKGAGEVWTLFIVGRRKHRQNVYRIEAK